MSKRIHRDVSPPHPKRQRIGNPRPIHLAPSLPSRPITQLEENRFRIFSWNVNGIAPFLQPSIKSFFKASRSDREQTPPSDYNVQAECSLRECLARWNYPQVLGLQEVKIRLGDSQTMTAVQNAVKQSSDLKIGYRAFFSLPRDKYNAKGFGGKVYGVTMLVRQDVLCPDVTVTEVDWDLEGRVLLLKIPGHHLAVFNVYAVNGTDNVWHDSQSGIARGTRHDKKRLFHSQLRAAAQELENNGWTVIVAGDINIARSSIDGFPGIRLALNHVQNRADFETKFMATTGSAEPMVDTFRHLHGDERKYSYRGRGVEWGVSCDRVDMILASSRAKESVVEADILDTKLERGPSDHVPIYVTLDLGKLGHVESISNPLTS